MIFSATRAEFCDQNMKNFYFSRRADIFLQNISTIFAKIDEGDGQLIRILRATSLRSNSDSWIPSEAPFLLLLCSSRDGRPAPPCVKKNLKKFYVWILPQAPCKVLSLTPQPPPPLRSWQKFSFAFSTRDLYTLTKWETNRLLVVLVRKSIILQACFPIHQKYPFLREMRKIWTLIRSHLCWFIESKRA